MYPSHMVAYALLCFKQALALTTSNTATSHIVLYALNNEIVVVGH